MPISSYSELPTEILIKIFHYLDFYDIQAVRLCCKHWCAVTNLSKYDGVFRIISCALDSNHPVGEVILHKQIEKLYLKSVQFGDVSKLFQHLGNTLKQLTLKLVPITIALRLTFEYFPHLQSLKVCQIKIPTLIEDVELLSVGNVVQLKELTLIANETSVNKYLLNYCTRHVDSLNRITIEFTKNDEEDVLRVLEKHSHSLTRLDLRFYQGRQLEVSRWINILETLNLYELCLQGNFYSDILVSATKAQSSLRSLDVTGSVAVDDAYLAFIADQLYVLERLILAYCGRITDTGVKHLAKFSHLKILNISCCNLLTSAGVRSCIGQQPNSHLLELHLQELSLDADFICFCANNLPNLRVFNLSGCSSNAVTNEAIQEIFDCLRELRDLRVNNCFRVSDAGMLGLATGSSIQNLTYLERLHLRGCKHISDATMRCGLKLPQLKFLDIAQCELVTNDGLEALVQNCPTLEEISISQSATVNNKAVQALTGGLGRLRKLIINNCKDPMQINTSNWNVYRFSKMVNEVTLKKYPRPSWSS